MSTQTPPPSTSSPDSSLDLLARQLRALKGLVAFLFLALAAGAGYVLYTRHQGQPVVILVGGAPVATVRNAAAANQILAAAEQAKIGPAYAGQTPIRLQTIQLQRAAADAPLDTDDDARQKLTRLLTLRVHAWVIVVNGKPSLGLPSEKEADRTLALVKQHFAQMPPQAQIVGAPRILENISLGQKVMDVARTRPNAASAAPYFWTPPPSKPYIVRRGDTGFEIAVRNHISLADFLAANANMDVNRLKPGDAVNVEKMPLLLSVEVKKTFTGEGAVISHAPSDEAGKQRITYIVTYLNGQEIKRDVGSVTLLQKPRTAYEL